MKIKDLTMSVPFSGIDWKLLAAQKKRLNGLRSKLPSCSKNYELLSGVIHLMDYLDDLHLDAINNIVLIRNYAEMKQYFTAEIYDCHSNLDAIMYEMVINTREIYENGIIIAYPNTAFSPADWADFKRYGLNNLFELTS